MDERDMVLRRFTEHERVLPHWGVDEIATEPLIVHLVTHGIDDEGRYCELGLERISGEIGFLDLYGDELVRRSSEVWPPVPFGIKLWQCGEDYKMEVFSPSDWN